MAEKYWIGGAAAVAQVSTGSIDSVDGTPSNNDFTVTIGGQTVTVTGDTDVATTAAALVSALNNATHPYFSGITWTNPSGGDITGTADTAGVPFEAALSVSGAGTGSVTDFSDDTASEGPSDWSTAANWSDGAVPAASDDVTISNSSDNISYGLDQNAVDLSSLTIDQTYTGKLGLPYNELTTSADGETTDSGAPEYRQSYLKIGYDTCALGRNIGTGSPAGSRRLKIECDKAGASTTTVYNTAANPFELGSTAVRLLLSNAGHDVFVRSARGGVGIGLGEPDETVTMGDLNITSTESTTRVITGAGVTLSNWYQRGGTNVIQAAATVAGVTVEGGELSTEGDYTITTLEVTGGSVFANHIKTSGDAITTANLKGGTLSALRSNESRTWATVNPDGGTLAADADVLTISTLNQPSDVYTMQVA